WEMPEHVGAGLAVAARVPRRQAGQGAVVPRERVVRLAPAEFPVVGGRFAPLLLGDVTGGPLTPPPGVGRQPPNRLRQNRDGLVGSPRAHLGHDLARSQGIVLARLLTAKENAAVPQARIGSRQVDPFAKGSNVARIVLAGERLVKVQA